MRPVPQHGLHTIVEPRSLTRPVPLHRTHISDWTRVSRLKIENRFPNAIVLSFSNSPAGVTAHFHVKISVENIPRVSSTLIQIVIDWAGSPRDLTADSLYEFQNVAAGTYRRHDPQGQRIALVAFDPSV